MKHHKITIAIPVTIHVTTDDEPPKDFDLDVIAREVLRRLNHYSDGRRSLIHETAEALLAPIIANAIQDSFFHALAKRYPNRSFATGPHSSSSAAAILSERRAARVHQYAEAHDAIRSP